MNKVNDIDVKAEDQAIEQSVQLLNQANQTYPQIERLLPAGRFKDDLLKFIANKRLEYVNRIVPK